MTNRPASKEAQGLSVGHIELVKSCLRSHVSPQHKVYIFGSRARGVAQPFSDLDLCIDGPDLSYSELSALQDELSESDLPFQVDVVQKSQLSVDFLHLIKSDFVELTL